MFNNVLTAKINLMVNTISSLEDLKTGMLAFVVVENLYRINQQIIFIAVTIALVFFFPPLDRNKTNAE